MAIFERRRCCSVVCFGFYAFAASLSSGLELSRLAILAPGYSFQGAIVDMDFYQARGDVTLWLRSADNSSIASRRVSRDVTLLRSYRKALRGLQ